MRYDDIEVHESIVNDNADIAAKNDKILERLEKLSSNSNIKYLNFKVMSTALFVGLIIGVLGSLSYSSYVTEPKEIVLKKEIKKLENDNDFLRIYLQKIVSKIPVNDMNK